MVGSISSGWASNSTQSTMRWQDKMVEAQGRANAVESRRDMADDKLAVKPEWQAPRLPQVTQAGSVDMYM
jgi:hypothetical protein